MKRLLSVCVMAVIGLSACDRQTMVAPDESAGSEALFAKAALPDFEPPEVCPTEGCLLPPTTLARETKAPTSWIGEFSGLEEQEVELVVYSSNPRGTTVKAWLNDKMVLSPSEMPKAESTEVRVPLSLQEGDVLEVRLSGKPGTQVAFWIAGVAEAPADPDGTDPTTEDPPTPEPAMTFGVTTGSVDIYADMNAACDAAMTGSVIADWGDVVEAMGSGLYQKEDVLSTGYAFVLNSGMGLFDEGIFSSSMKHYVLSAFGPLGPNYASIGEDFALEGSADAHAVLCVLK